MNIEKIRLDFPILRETPGRKPLVYLDNACQSLRPAAVLDVIDRYYRESSACSGRSMHRLAAEVTQRCDEARATVARFLNAARKEEIVFTRNTTESINLVANSFELRPGDAVLVTGKEHNSNLIPWQMLARRQGVQLKVLPPRPDNTFDFDAYQAALDPQVKLVAMGWTSNLDGVSIPAAEVVRLAHQRGARVLLDAAQTTQHQRINVKSLDVDFLVFSGHKVLGPSGTGVLYAKYRLLEEMQPFLVGGDTVAFSTYDSCQFLPPPAKFEAGLQDYAGILGLGAALQYLMNLGFEEVQRQELLLNQAVSAAVSDIPGLHLIGPADPGLRGGILAFHIEGIDAHRIALMLDQMAGVMVRSGQHCVHSWFHARGIPGSVRASLAFYNTLAEAELFAANLKKIRKVL